MSKARRQSNEELEARLGGLETPFAAQSLTENGYQKLPGGMVMQWGTIPSVIGNNVYADITLPIPFPTATLNVQCAGYTEGDDLSDVGVQVTSFTSSTLRLLLNTSGGTHKIMWFAIGY